MNRAALEQVAEKYRADGYEVHVLPAKAELPEFLKHFTPDLLAYRGQEKVVIEVKNRSDLRKDASLSYVAAEVNSQPGWRFDLIVQASDTSFDPIFSGSTEPSIDGILQLAADAERLAASGELTAACLLAWSGVEAALRRLASQAGLNLESTSPLYLLNALATEGLLAQPDYATLNSLFRLRNSLAHGLKSTSITRDAPAFLIDLTRRIVAPANQRTAAV
jgi:hypothetical protein